METVAGLVSSLPIIPWDFSLPLPCAPAPTVFSLSANTLEYQEPGSLSGATPAC